MGTDMGKSALKERVGAVDVSQGAAQRAAVQVTNPMRGIWQDTGTKHVQDTSTKHV